LIAARLFRSGVTPQTILQVSAVLLAVSVLIYLRINGREDERSAAPAPRLSAGGGFQLVLSNRYLQLIAALVVLLNLVNTTGEYLVARLLTNHVQELALANPAFNKQAYIGAFSGNYQFWVNVSAFLLQAFVTSRLVKYRGLRGVLLALPLIALGGYAIVAAGVGFSVVRWIKTAENATDYSIMNTARQLLWLPTTREEKYKAKQAIDTFFVRGGDVLSAAVVYVGASRLHLTVQQFAVGNILMTLVWMGIALWLVTPPRAVSRVAFRPMIARAAAVVLLVLATALPALAQETREAQIASQQAQKAAQLHEYEPAPLERKLERVDSFLNSDRPMYAFVGSAFEGGGIALGPGYRARYGDTGTFDAHAGWSIKNYKVADATFRLPKMADGRVSIELRGNWRDAPDVAFFGTGNDSRREDRTGFSYTDTRAGVTTRFQAAKFFAVGGGLDVIQTTSGPARIDAPVADIDANYRKSRVFSEFDWRTSPRYTRSGGLYRVELADYHQTNAGALSFRRMDAEVQQFFPILRENWVIALRALASSASTASGQDVPYFMMPDLGGSRGLRGYPSWRFRDRNRLLLSGEYRWTAGPFADMALFLDAGKVESRVKALDFDHLKKTYGIGLTLHTLTSTVTRIELARTPEGTSLGFAFSPSF